MAEHRRLCWFWLARRRPRLRNRTGARWWRLQRSAAQCRRPSPPGLKGQPISDFERQMASLIQFDSAGRRSSLRNDTFISSTVCLLASRVVSALIRPSARGRIRRHDGEPRKKMSYKCRSRYPRKPQNAGFSADFKKHPGSWRQTTPYAPTSGRWENSRCEPLRASVESVPPQQAFQAVVQKWRGRSYPTFSKANAFRYSVSEFIGMIR